MEIKLSSVSRIFAVRQDQDISLTFNKIFLIFVFNSNVQIDATKIECVGMSLSTICIQLQNQLIYAAPDSEYRSN